MKLIILASIFLHLAFNASGQTLAIRDVSLIDMAGKKAKRGMTVVLEGNRIVQIGRSVRLPEGATLIDGRGKFLIPGLWDMHSHFLFEQFRDPFMKLVLANGVTGVRDMGGEQLDQLATLRKHIADGKIVGPRIVAPGPIVDGPKPVWEFSIPVSTPDDGRKAVQTLKAKGADFVKVYSLLSRESYLAIADEAKKQAIPFAGHIPNAVSAAEASDAGQKSVDHIRIYLDVSSDEEALRKERLAAESKGQMELNKIRAAQSERIMNTLSEQKLKLLAQRFLKNGTWFVPTLAVHRGFAFLDDATFAQDPRMKYMPEVLRSYWKSQRDRTPADVTKRGRAFYTKDLQIVGLMHRFGAKLLAGSDTMNPYVYPGFSLHDELQLLVEAGLTPFEALKTATVNPAIYLGREKELGTIAKGKFADLVLLDADPLADIRNTTKINAVILNGRLYDRKTLDALLSEAEETAKKE